MGQSHGSQHVKKNQFVLYDLISVLTYQDWHGSVATQGGTFLVYSMFMIINYNIVWFKDTKLKTEPIISFCRIFFYSYTNTKYYYQMHQINKFENQFYKK